MAGIAEDIERAALKELHAVATPEIIASLGLKALDVGASLVSIAGALPASAIVINRVLGLGLRSPTTQAMAKDIVEAYKESGVERYFVQLDPEAQPSDLVKWFVDLGLEKARGWQKFSRGCEVVPEGKTDLTIRQIGPADAAAHASILSDAFDLGDDARAWLSLVPQCEHWHVFMSFDGDKPAGTGSVFIDGDAAWLDFGATAPQFRKRGRQSALLRARIGHALDNGCTQLFTCTGEDVPGDPQHSYANILKCGFKEEYVRANYAPPKQSAAS